MGIGQPMIAYFRNLLAALQGLTETLELLVVVYSEDVDSRRLEGDSEARLSSLELERTTLKVDLEALVAEAKGQYRAASNAEARTRTHAKAAGVFDDDQEEETVTDFEAHYRELMDSVPEHGEDQSRLPLDHPPGSSRREIRDAWKATAKAIRSRRTG